MTDFLLTGKLNFTSNFQIKLEIAFPIANQGHFLNKIDLFVQIIIYQIILRYSYIYYYHMLLNIKYSNLRLSGNAYINIQ